MENTYDDGLPATYDDFQKLLVAIRAKGVVPFSYSGAASTYVSRAMTDFWATYEGVEKMKVNYTFNGTVDIVESISNGVAITRSVDINESNGYLLQKQPGKYYALQFLEDIFLGNSKNYKQNGMSHLEAQNAFIKGAIVNNATTYAIHVDGIWWENEASAAQPFHRLDVHHPPAHLRDRRIRHEQAHLLC